MMKRTSCLLKTLTSLMVLVLFCAVFYGCSSGRTSSSQASLGSDVSVPDVIGLTLDDATKQIEDAGLKADTQSDDGRHIIDKSNWTVIEQTPEAKTAAQPKSKVILTVSKDKDAVEKALAKKAEKAANDNAANANENTGKLTNANATSSNTAQPANNTQTTQPQEQAPASEPATQPSQPEQPINPEPAAPKTRVEGMTDIPVEFVSANEDCFVLDFCNDDPTQTCLISLNRITIGGTTYSLMDGSAPVRIDADGTDISTYGMFDVYPGQKCRLTMHVDGVSDYSNLVLNIDENYYSKETGKSYPIGDLDIKLVTR